MDEYIYLFSNFNAIRYYGKPNRIGQFKNQLASSLSLSPHTKVALSEIAYTKSWYNVKHTYTISLYDEMSTQLNFNIDAILKAGHYDTPDILVTEINRELKKFPIKKSPSLEYNSKENYVYLHSGKTDFHM